jgi:ABC-type branched-subunit amino acid transport system substrate-binding protein
VKGKLFGLLLTLTLVVSLASGAGAANPGVTGITKDTIKLGITYVDFTNLHSKGIVLDTDHGDYEGSFRAVIDDLNAHGGVDGRQIEPVFAPIDPLGTTPAQEACVKLTEDEQVFAVVGFFLDTAPLCYVENHATPILGGTITSELLARAKAPWFSMESGDATFAVGIDALAKEKAFKKTPIGVIALNTQEDQLKNLIDPALKKNKVKFTDAIVDAPPGDVPAGDRATDTILQRFQADGVKTIVAVDSAIAQVFRRLPATDYRPRVISTNANTYIAAAQDEALDPKIAANSLSVGGQVDFNDPAMQACYKIVEKALGNEIVEFVAQGEVYHRISADSACRYIALFKEIVEAAGKNLTAKSFAKAAAKHTQTEAPGGPYVYDKATHSYVGTMFLYRYHEDTGTVLPDDDPVDV